MSTWIALIIGLVLCAVLVAPDATLLILTFIAELVAAVVLTKILRVKNVASGPEHDSGVIERGALRASLPETGLDVISPTVGMVGRETVVRVSGLSRGAGVLSEDASVSSKEEE